MDPSTTQPRRRGRIWALALAMVLLACLAYLPAFTAGFIWDDDHYITENRHLESLDGLRRLWLELGATHDYYPLTFTTFWLERRLWGLWAPGYHAVNILMHAANAIVLWRLLRRLGIPGAWLGAALFLLHPVQVESVAWATERKTLLATMLGLLCFHCHLNHQPPRFPARVAVTNPSRWWLLPTVLCFAGAMLAKTIAVTFPPAMAVVLAWREGGAVRRRLPVLALLLLVAAPLCYAGFWTQTHVVGAQGPVFDLTWAQRLLLVGRAAWFYLSCLVWPVQLSFVYPRWDLAPTAWWQWLYPIGAAALVGTLLVLRRRVGTAPLTALLAYGLMLGPALGVFKIYWQIYSYVADHVQYAAAIAPLALLGAAVARARQRLSPRGAAVLTTAVVALCIALGGLCVRESRQYHDLETLWRTTLAKNDGAWLAHNNLASLLAERGEYAPAIAHVRRATELADWAPEVHANQAEILGRNGQWEAVLAPMRRAIDRYGAESAATGILLNKLAGAQNRLGRADEAVETHKRAAAFWAAKLRANRADGMALHEMATALLGLGENADALVMLEAAVAITPGYPGGQARLAKALIDAGRAEEGVQRFKSALRDYPSDAGLWRLYAWTLATHSDPTVRNGAAAVEAATRARQLTSDQDLDSLDALAAAHAAAGDPARAVQFASAAAELALRQGLTEKARQMHGRAQFYQSGRGLHELPATSQPASPP